MFMGTYKNSIDAKNRMIVPVKLREQLGGRCIITQGMDRCLYIYPLSEWEKQQADLSVLPRTAKPVREFIRDTFSNAEECEFDKQGRILIPAGLLQWAFIDKELVTVGAMNKIEIWSKEVWDNPDDYASVPEKDYLDKLLEYNF